MLHADGYQTATLGPLCSACAPDMRKVHNSGGRKTNARGAIGKLEACEGTVEKMTAVGISKS